MTSLEDRFRQTSRASGYAAVTAVVLFLVVGVVVLARGDVKPTPTSSEWVAAGEELGVAMNTRGPILGLGAELDPAGVQCSWTSPQGGSGVLERIAPAAREVRKTSEGQAQLIADASGTDARHVVCAGGGLERFAPTGRPSAPPARALGTGFFVLAGVAALWATATLSRRRRR